MAKREEPNTTERARSLTARASPLHTKRAEQDYDDEFFEDEYIEEDIPPESALPSTPWKRALLIGIGVVLVILFVSYLSGGDWLYPILEGRVESDVIGADYIVNVTETVRVVFAPDVYRELLRLYYDQPEHEFKACLIGTKSGNDYLIDDLSLPETYQRSFAHVIAEQCPPVTIVSLHTHPFKHCIFSDVDIESYDAFLTVNPDAIIGLMCEPERFTFHGRAISDKS